MATFSISIPSQIAQQIDSEVNKLGFSTRSEFIRAILRRYFSNKISLEEFEGQSLKNIRLELAKTGKYSEKFINSIVSGLEKSSVYANSKPAS